MSCGVSPCAPAHPASWPRSTPYARRVRSDAPRVRRSRSKSTSASRHAGGRRGALLSSVVGVFFIDTTNGQVATAQQLVEAGIAVDRDGPGPPWHRIRGTDDATTLWYAVMRKKTRGVYIGSLVIRHSDHHASLLGEGWEEIAPAEIGVEGTRR